jgi:hypothetical protein
MRCSTAASDGDEALVVAGDSGDIGVGKPSPDVSILLMFLCTSVCVCLTYDQHAGLCRYDHRLVIRSNGVLLLNESVKEDTRLQALIRDVAIHEHPLMDL